MDRDGYGFGPEDHGLGRLLDDFRSFSPSGIERAAWGWDRHVGDRDLTPFHESERAALRAIEQGDRGATWDRARHTVFGLTEGASRLVSWRAEHGEMGHKAERAAYGAVLALVAASLIPDENRVVLLRPLAEALPWLLPESPPEPHPLSPA
ncbi:MAG: hypothetical protein ACREPA_11430 [Candidatus Dormibacteraceae bacterium]